MQQNSIFFFWPENILIWNMGNRSRHFHVTFWKIPPLQMEIGNEALEKFDLEITNEKSFINWKQVILRNLSKVYKHQINSIPPYLLNFTTIHWPKLLILILPSKINEPTSLQTTKPQNTKIILDIKLTRIFGFSGAGCKLQELQLFVISRGVLVLCFRCLSL